MASPASNDQALGARARVQDAFAQAPVRFRLEFTHDRRSRELRWVLFAGTQRGSVGKLVFTLERDGAAHIKSLAVNAEYRGLGLARVLCLACLSSLRELAVSQLVLEAEEDTKRHGKLVGLYESWGFRQKPDEKVLFLYNDTQCFRKVPMALPCGDGAFLPVQPSAAGATWFFMLTLQTVDGACLVASEDGAIAARKQAKSSPESLWQTLLGADGEIFLRSTHGKFLCVEESGHILADRQRNSTWETFQVVPHQQSAVAGGVALRDFHGNYLSIDPEQQAVVSSREPVPWDGGDMMALVCNKLDAAPLFFKILRKLQTRAFVTQQVAAYGSCQHAALSVADACSWLARLNGDADARDSWVIKYMLATAEAVRADGHPDWLQLAVFLRALGMLFLCWSDEGNAALRSISAREWLTQNTTWVVGQAIPDSVGFPELNALNSDHNDGAKSASGAAAAAAAAAVGIDSVTLPWTPDEYLFRVLEFNKASMPAEALQAIRFWSLRAWYVHGSYDALCAPQDFEVKEWLQSLVPYATRSDDALQHVQPDALMPYYLALADKYLPAVLQW